MLSWTEIGKQACDSFKNIYAKTSDNFKSWHAIHLVCCYVHNFRLLTYIKYI